MAMFIQTNQKVGRQINVIRAEGDNNVFSGTGDITAKQTTEVKAEYKTTVNGGNNLTGDKEELRLLGVAVSELLAELDRYNFEGDSNLEDALNKIHDLMGEQ